MGLWTSKRGQEMNLVEQRLEDLKQLKKLLKRIVCHMTLKSMLPFINFLMNE